MFARSIGRHLSINTSRGQVMSTCLSCKLQQGCPPAKENTINFRNCSFTVCEEQAISAISIINTSASQTLTGPVIVTANPIGGRLFDKVHTVNFDKISD